MLTIPEHLQIELREAEMAIDEAQVRMNGVQMEIARWCCTQGEHVFGFYTLPPIGRACIYCRIPAPAECHEEGRSDA